ncbi:NADH dehydrogenase [ubiquinone] iron-sulfur protein 6, mitochondrial isoform X2 [Chrysemys picta bellii]|uniref:NADH dehydrogenase [ubiquinone] iron-sulfur protein 6, mitochondrial isoform X2 n=1 Tax=Chrysemys picta bellii TaxID=8478 RepID=UPI0032B10458
MAAPYSTFRRLLLLRRLAPVRVAAAPPRRGYGARVSESGESVTHTGQVTLLCRNGLLASPELSRPGWGRFMKKMTTGRFDLLLDRRRTKIRKLEHVVTVDFSLNRNIITERSSLHALQNFVIICV